MRNVLEDPVMTKPILTRENMFDVIGGPTRIAAYNNVRWIAEGLDENNQRALLERVIDWYYWDDDEIEQHLALSGEQLKDSLIRALMNFMYPGSI